MNIFKSFFGLFRSSSKAVVLVMIQDAVNKAKTRVLIDSDKPAVREAKEAAIDALAAILVEEVNEKL